MSKTQYSISKINYYMDLENEALSSYDDKKSVLHRGWERAFNKDWINHMKRYVDYGVIDDDFYTKEECVLIAVERYRDWVKRGGGVEWFLKTNDSESDPSYQSDGSIHDSD